MKRYRGITVTVLAALAVAICTTNASAEFDKGEQKCRKLIAKGTSLMVKTVNKAIATCHKDQQKDKIADGVDCNDTSAPEVDPKLKIPKIVTKVTGLVDKKCAALDDDVLANYISCPVDPCAGVVSNPMTSYGEFASCLVCLTSDSTEVRNAALLGAFNPAPAGADAKCSQAVAKGYGKLVDTIIKDRTKCQAGADKIETSHHGNDVGLHCAVSGRSCATDLDCQTPGDTCVGCLAADEKGKIAKAKTKAEASFDKACIGDTTGIIPCGDPDPAVAKACLAAAAEAHGDEMVLATYELDATICPTGIEALLFAGNGIGPDLVTPVLSRSTLDVGWSGVGHGQDLPDRYKLNLDVANCAGGASTPCGQCDITGVAQAAPNTSYLLRCRDNHTISCTTPFANDAACPSNTLCTYYLSGPLPLNAANSPVCVLNRLDTDLTGTANVETGDSEISIPDLRSAVFLGANATRPCALCAGKCTAGNVGDGCVTDADCETGPGNLDGVCDLTTEIPGDGVKNGVCLTGISAGLSCDIHALDATFTPGPGTGTSLDCRVGTSADSILKLKLNLTTDTSSLPANLPCQGAFSGFNCPCGICTGDTSVTCQSDLECSGAGLGTCTGSTASSATRQPNNCSDDAFVCTDTGDGVNGECASSTVTFCDGVVRAGGDGFLTCFTNADCDAIAASCEGDCGDCLIEEQTKCFLDTILATGEPDPENPVLVTTFCIPPALSSGVNSTGLPGPARVKLDAQVTKTY